MPIRINTLERPSGRGKVQSEDGQDLAIVSYGLRVTQRERDVSGFSGRKPEWLALGHPDTQGTLRPTSRDMGGQVDAIGRSFVLILDDGRKLPFNVARAMRSLGQRNIDTITYEIKANGPFEKI